MKNIEIKKFKHLKINWLFLLMFLAHIFIVLFSGLDKSFENNKLPVYYLIDSYLVFSIIFNPILLSSMVKKVIEIEDKNNTWQVQLSLGEKVNKILISKLKALTLKLVILIVVEFLMIFILSTRSNYFILDIEVVIRSSLVFLSTLVINIFTLVLFMILEIKVSKIYFTSFLSIIGALTGIITMLTSKVLAYINPFAWLSSLINISYVRMDDKFLPQLNPINYLTFLIALASLLAAVDCLSRIKNVEYKKEF